MKAGVNPNGTKNADFDRYREKIWGMDSPLWDGIEIKYRKDSQNGYFGPVMLSGFTAERQLVGELTFKTGMILSISILAF